MNTPFYQDEYLQKEHIIRELENLSGSIDPSSQNLSIILAAGHGKRIKSEKSKMLHQIWGKPSLLRVCEAAASGLESDNQIVVVGIKALEVGGALGKRKNRVFVYQEEQKGTGDAVKTALEYKGLTCFQGNVYVFPGDMGLLSAETVKNFKENFTSSNCHMMVMTGFFTGDIQDNYYGRIIKSKANHSEVIEIKEHRDILAMRGGEKYTVHFKRNTEQFTRDELLNIREFNTGVYAFQLEPLKKYIYHITTDNVQGEIYVTDLIKIFNDNNLKVASSRVTNNHLVVAFNVKSVLTRMEGTFRSMVYEKLKDIISIDDPEDFFIAEETVQRIIEMDSHSPALDIIVGKGTYIGENVRINRGLAVERHATLRGNIKIGKNVTIGENVFLSTYPDQTMEIGNNVQILRGTVIKGRVKLGNNVRIETGVRITGSSSEPVIIGNNVLIKGMTYIFGSVVEDDILIEHSILKSMYVERVVKKSGEIQPIKYILPPPKGLDSISERNRASSST
ncbi:MAG: NTP transferase domain-containing protein [Spirochaetota bacterium]